MAVDASTFAPRQVFGEYVRALLNDELRRSGRDRLELRGEVISIERTGRRLKLGLARDRLIEADYAVPPVDHVPPAPMPVATPDFYDTRFYRSDP